MGFFFHSRVWPATVSAAVILGLVGCNGSPPIVGIRISEPTSLLDLFPQARITTTVTTEREEFVNVRDVRVEDGPERVLFLYPKTEVMFPLRLEQAAVLETAIAVTPEAWKQGGDGMTFYVAVRRQDDLIPTYLFNQHISPQSVEEHRGWQPVQLDLTSLRGTDFELILGTDPGPAVDADFDWGVWRNPRLYNPALENE